MCVVGVTVYTHTADSHDADLQEQRGKERESIVHFIHTHAHTLIKKQVRMCKIAPWCMPSFILRTHIIQHDNSQVWCPLLLSPVNSILAKCRKTTRLCGQYAVMSEISWLAGCVNTRGVCSSCHKPTNVTPRTHTASIIMKPLHY